MVSPNIMNNAVYESWWWTVYEDDVSHSRNKITKPSKNKSIKASKNNGVHTNEHIFDEKEITDFFFLKDNKFSIMYLDKTTKSLEPEDIVKTLNNDSVSF